MNAVVYARYSSHAQSEQSIEGQLRECRAFAEREGYTIVHEYIDRAITGRSDDRPDFQRMIADAQKKQFQFVIVWKLDRFARNRYDSAIYKARLKKYGVRVISATENIGDGAEGIILEGILESMAEYYSANLSKHVKRGMRESVINGTSTGGTVPIGFKALDKRLVIDEDVAPHIRLAFEQYADGTPKKDILATLNAKGVRNRAGKMLTQSSLQRVFRNEKYIGKFMYNGEEIVGCCEPIVDEAIFQRVQERIDAIKRAPAEKKAKIEYLLSGKAFCGMCGARLIGENGRGKSGGIYHYYTCADRKAKHSCLKKNEKKGFLEWYVVEQTVLYVLTPERMEYIATRIVEEYDNEFGNQRIGEYERNIARIDRDVNKLIDSLLVLPTKAAVSIGEKIEVLQTQKEDMEADLSRLRIANGIHYTKEQIIAWLKSFCRGDLLDEEFQKRIIDVFVNAVYVYDDRVIVYYNVRGGKQISYIEMLDSTEEPGNEAFEEPLGVRVSDAMTHHKKQIRTLS